MSTPWYRRLSEGLSRSRERLGGQLNVLLRRGPNLDEEFWSDLEDTLIGADMGLSATNDIVTRLRRDAAAKALPDAQAVIDALTDAIASEFSIVGDDILAIDPLAVLMVGVNGTGKTTTVGKLAKQAVVGHPLRVPAQPV